MGNYKHILLSVELIPEVDSALIKTGIAMAKESGADLILVHAVEYMSSYGAAYGISVTAEMENLLLQNAQKEMHALGKKLGIPENHQIVRLGFAKSVILDAAEEKKIDLILVGTHGRHGFKILLGSTANAILHSAKCDVLAVRVKK